MPKGVARSGPSGRPTEIEPVSLEAAREAAVDLLLAEEAYIAAIVAASESGNSIYRISIALGVSDDKIRRIVDGQSRFILGNPRG